MLVTMFAAEIGEPLRLRPLRLLWVARDTFKMLLKGDR